jgi:hypothetical protein
VLNLTPDYGSEDNKLEVPDQLGHSHNIQNDTAPLVNQIVFEDKKTSTFYIEIQDE